MAVVSQAEAIVFEVEDNYQKQTYRNRCYIAHTNGKLLLSVPILHSKNGERLKMKNVSPENNFPWQKEHWKSIKNAYQTSPFFEFYEDEFAPLFTKTVTNLLDHNLQIFDTLCDVIGINVLTSKTEEYIKNPIHLDGRTLTNAKHDKEYTFAKYTQVLEAHHGWLPNMSVLDVLFNEGPNTLNYLESQNIKI